MKKKTLDKLRNTTKSIPKIGDDIYVESALYLGHGEDDILGGLAKVTSVTEEMIGEEKVIKVTVVGIPGVFNWSQRLAGLQDKLKERFGNIRAHPEPDDRPKFNKE